MNKVVLYPNKNLSVAASGITKMDRFIHQHIQHLYSSLDFYNQKVLSGPTVGIPYSIIAYTDSHNSKKCIINPVVVQCSTDNTVCCDERCICYGDFILRDIVRYNTVTIAGVDFFSGKSHSFILSGFLGRLFQHEIDHVNGILPSDKMDGFTQAWKKRNCSK